MDKFGIITFTDEWKNHKKFHFVRTISNQFANRENIKDTLHCIQQMRKIAENENKDTIAINLNYDSLRHYLHFKNTLIETFENSNISITIYQNKITEIIEREDIEKILNIYHKSLLGGHIGSEKMFKTISKFFKWPNMQNDIKEYVKKCSICEKTKVIKNIKMPMEISSLGEHLFDHTCIDFVGPVSPQSSEGHKYIFTAICDLTQFLIAIPTFDCTSLTTAECLLSHIFLKYNFPSRLISDNATSFHSQVIKEINHLFKIKKIFSTPYHAQSNKVERSHRTLGAFLKAFTIKNKESWHDLLKYATFAYNNSIHSTTGYTPHELAHGFRIQIPTHLTQQKTTYNYDNLAEMTRNNIARALELAKEHLQSRKIKNKQYYDEKTNEINIEINDLVLVRSQVKKDKFQVTYDGPFRVTDVFDSYVEIMKGNKRSKIHKNLIKKAEADYEKEPPLKFPLVTLDDGQVDIVERINNLSIKNITNI